MDAELVRPVGVYSNLGRPERGLAEQVNFAFSCEWVEGQPRAGDELPLADQGVKSQRRRNRVRRLQTLTTE